MDCESHDKMVSLLKDKVALLYRFIAVIKKDLITELERTPMDEEKCYALLGDFKEAIKDARASEKFLLEFRGNAPD